jgi:glutathione S-transferase
MMDATVLTRLESLRPEAQRSEAFVARQTAAVGRGLELLDAEVPEGFDIGAIAVGCALGYLDLRLARLDWRASHPALAAWFADVSERPAMKTTAPA